MRACARVRVRACVHVWVVVVVEVAVVVGSGLVQGCIGCAHPSIKVRREDDP